LKSDEINFPELNEKKEQGLNCAQSMPKNIESYQKIPKSVEIREPLKRGVLQGNPLIFCAFASIVAAYTR
jgi:hypothetical protein